MLIIKNLKKYNTFGINCIANTFYEVKSVKYLRTLWNQRIFDSKYFILGKGSNVLFVKDSIDIPIIKINIKGFTKHVFQDFVDYSVCAGEDWDKLVEITVKDNLWGLVNLSLIPGSVGASVVQNIGAYGVEVEKYVQKVEYFDIKDGSIKTITKEECKFGYRDSIFKHKLKHAIITKVVFRIPITDNPNLEYIDIQNYLTTHNIHVSSLTPSLLREIIIKIRKSKIPYPDEVGNAGSFFKNPIVSIDQLNYLKKNYPDIKYSATQFLDKVKVSAGWLIEKCGWKGWISECKRYGVSSKHALVLVNYGGAKGSDIFKLAQKINQSIYNAFGINLENEVVIIF